MLVFLPILLLLLTALGGWLLFVFRSKVGYTWFAAAVGAIICWGVVLAYRWIPLSPFAIEDWRPFRLGSGNELLFSWDQAAWPYAISIVSVLVAVILTASVRLVQNSNPVSWSANLAITGLSLLTILAANPLTVAVTWTAVDVLELVIVLGVVKNWSLSRQMIYLFLARGGGTILLLISVIYSRYLGLPLEFEAISSQIGWLVIVGIGLRLGVMPINVPIAKEFPLRRGIGTILRLIGPVSSLPVLARLPAEVLTEAQIPLILGLTALATLFGSAMWAHSKDEIAGRSYWIIALAGMAIGTAIQGYSAESISFGVALILIGGFLFLFSDRRKEIIFFPILCVLGLSGLPFTLTATGWQGLIHTPLNIWQIIFLISGVYLFGGYLRHAFSERESLKDKERWIQSTYILGFIFIQLTLWIIPITNNPLSSVQSWWIGLIAGFFGSLAYLIQIKMIHLPTTTTISLDWLQLLLRQLGGFLAKIFSLNWFYQILVFFYRLVQQIIFAFTAIFEGDGGILWTMVLLALLLSILAAGGI